MRTAAWSGLLLCFSVALALCSRNPNPEASAAFDGQTNGMVDQTTHAADQKSFDEVEETSDGLGPLYNAQSCRECHQSPTSGGITQTAEVRVGHRGANGQFENPSIPINDGKAVITGRTLVNSRAICPSAAFPDVQLQELVPDSENIRTNRLSLNLLGDGFVEAVPDQALLDLARDQCHATHRRICGQVLYVPILEAPGKTGVGRFGWKDQHASVLSFAADAYLNEMGITNRLIRDEVTLLCNPSTVSEPNNQPDSDGLEDIDRFARFVRAAKAPPRDASLAQTAEASDGSKLFDKIGCGACHVSTLVTAPAGTAINGGAFTVPAALGSKQFHPFGDFLLHNVGTGDGIPVAMEEHYGKASTKRSWARLSYPDFQTAANKVRTAPLWGVRTHSRLMHDGESMTLTDAIERHKGEAEEITEKFKRLKPRQKEALLTFLKSL
jgi:CxxC motif-containing protein (DUF1111 family)